MCTAALVLSNIGCSTPTGPSEELTGNWTASRVLGSPRDPTSLLVLTLHQTDDTVSGTACERIGSFLLYQDVPVSGDYPRVEFTVTSGYTGPCCAHWAGIQFFGRLGNSGDIVGRIGGDNVRFRRSQTDACR